LSCITYTVSGTVPASSCHELAREHGGPFEEPSRNLQGTLSRITNGFLKETGELSRNLTQNRKERSRNPQIIFGVLAEPACRSDIGSDGLASNSCRQPFSPKLSSITKAVRDTISAPSCHELARDHGGTLEQPSRNLQGTFTELS